MLDMQGRREMSWGREREKGGWRRGEFPPRVKKRVEGGTEHKGKSGADEGRRRD